MSKITKATIKSFINKNRENLVIKSLSNFDGSTDCLELVHENFHRAEVGCCIKHSLGVNGLWLVNNSRCDTLSRENI